MARGKTGRVLGVVAAAWSVVAVLGVGFRVLADCSSLGLPFTDLGSTSFCAQIAEAYFSGLSNGTSATTYSPSDDVPREQMAAFVTRTLDFGLSRGNRRSKLQQFWNGAPRWDLGFGLTTVGSLPFLLQSDGKDVWVADSGDGTVYRVEASDGKVLSHWTGATGAIGVLVALGRVFVTGNTIPGKLFMINPSATAGAVATVATVGDSAGGVAFDGMHIWTANGGGSVTIVTPGSTTPWPKTTVTKGFSSPVGAIFDGSNVWVTDSGDGTIKKLDATGAILQTVSVGGEPQYPAFDGTNIWVPTFSGNSVSVVRASTATVVATLTGNGLSSPNTAAFDGQRVLVTDGTGGLSLFQATSLAAIGNPATTGITEPLGACSDGSGFWISGITSNAIGRF